MEFNRIAIMSVLNRFVSKNYKMLMTYLYYQVAKPFRCQ